MQRVLGRPRLANDLQALGETTESIKDPVPTTEKSEILTGRPESTLPERKRVEVRPPMEKLNLAMEKAKRRKDEE